ncbi:MAG: NADH-quinone oxidoreductase subunit M [Planctomycetes bacterium]|nr:NADH-quinone oxidoreductase subunit M [Planctomycetota bacterium]
MPSLLVIMIFLPAVAAVMLLLLDAKAPPVRARWTALLATLATFVVSLGVASQFLAVDRTTSVSVNPVHPVMELKHTWLNLVPATPEAPGISLEFSLGLDGISLSLVLLTTLLTISAVMVSWTAISERSAEFYACLLILESGLIGVFCAFDLVLFYVFFEFTLIPLFFLVGIWGGPLRRYAAGKFFIYTLAGSVITLLGLIWLVVETYQMGLKTHEPLETPLSIPAISGLLMTNALSTETQVAIFLMIAAGFMVKVPLFPFHTWLPLAHVEAPTAGSVLLAGVLLKLGSYGFLRLCLPILPHACLNVGLPLVGALSVIGIVYGSMCALAQNDIKKLVAYSSVAHLGFCMLGLFALNNEGVSGGVLQMINHGLSTGALFCIVGMFYERYHTRELSQLGGLASRLPLLGVAMVFTSFASIGLPGLNGFVGEMLALIGMFKRDPILAVIGASGVVLGAWYLLGVLQKAFFGPLQEPHHHGHEPIVDLNAREVLTLAPLLAACLWLGLFPQPVLDLIRPDVESLTKMYGDVKAMKGAKAQVTQLPVSLTELASATPVSETITNLQKLATPEAPKSEVRP